MCVSLEKKFVIRAEALQDCDGFRRLSRSRLRPPPNTRRSLYSTHEKDTLAPSGSLSSQGMEDKIRPLHHEKIHHGHPRTAYGKKEKTMKSKSLPFPPDKLPTVKAVMNFVKRHKKLLDGGIITMTESQWEAYRIELSGGFTQLFAKGIPVEKRRKRC